MSTVLNARTRRTTWFAACAAAIFLPVAGLTVATATAAATATFVVTDNGDGDDASGSPDGVCLAVGGGCTLRAAVAEANAVGGPVAIRFAIPGTGVHRIDVVSQITIDSNVTIDGYTQPGSTANTSAIVDNAVRNIELVGTDEAEGDGLVIEGSGNVIRGLILHGFHRAIVLEGTGASANLIAGNMVGLAPGGGFHDPTAYADERFEGAHCIDLTSGASDNRIGAPGAANRNVIGGCLDKGVNMRGSLTARNSVQNNLIGLDPSGSQRRQSIHGVDIGRGANNNLVGGTGPQERNVISGNSYAGVEVSHNANTVDNSVIGNYIGTTPDGRSATEATANGRYGVRLEGRPNCGTEPCTPDLKNVTVSHNVIVNSGFGGILVDKGTTDSVIADNQIGVSVDGTAIGNNSFGIMLASGAHNIEVGPGNTIAGSLVGVAVTPFSYAPAGSIESDTSGNTITRNSITAEPGLAIDLAPFDQVNSAATSNENANEGVVAPTLSTSGSSIVATTCAGCTVELFRADRMVGHHGSGIAYLSTATADGSGVATFARPSGGFPAALTATTTTVAGSTSEFSRNIAPGSETTPPPPPPPPITPDSLLPVVPARLLETRSANDESTIDGQYQGIGARPARTITEVQVAGRGGVPDDAVAAFLNVTAIFGDSPGFLTVFPCGTPLPTASNVNYFPGQVEPNAVFTKIGTDGNVCIYNLSPTDMIVDVSGYVHRTR